jgi:oxygen-independent coproporphyrinogen III oxidase
MRPMLQALESSTPGLDRKLLPADEAPGLYVHIPFCFHKCHYCDFYSITRQTPERMRGFVDLLLREAREWGRGSQVNVRPRTVFFGGGTPTLLPAAEMKRLIAGLRSIFDFSACDEWTVEANPDTLSEAYCQALAESGVNRISMGAQSFDKRELALLERHHDPAHVSESVSLSRAAGFKRLNVDLIYGIPGQTLETWLQSLQTALALQTDHLSCYGLTYEPNTPMAVRKRLGQFEAAPEERELEMLRETRRRLAEHGMPAYEISNYARPGEECRHNLLYWNGGNYIGLGPSAASHVSGWRWRNRPHLGEWENAVRAEGLAAIEVEHLSPRHRAGELAMLNLRLSRGIEFARFAQQTGFDARELFPDILQRFEKPGLLAIGERNVRLTERGIPVADAVAGEFLAAAMRV